MNGLDPKQSLRCGLCDRELFDGESWADHVNCELHQSHIYHRKAILPMPKPEVRQVSEAEKRLNKKEGKIAMVKENLGYYGQHGRSYHKLRCECGEVSDVYRWSGRKRCPNCWKIISYAVSRMMDVDDNETITEDTWH